MLARFFLLRLAGGGHPLQFFNKCSFVDNVLVFFEFNLQAFCQQADGTLPVGLGKYTQRCHDIVVIDQDLDRFRRIKLHTRFVILRYFLHDLHAMR